MRDAKKLGLEVVGKFYGVAVFDDDNIEFGSV